MTVFPSNHARRFIRTLVLILSGTASSADDFPDQHAAVAAGDRLAKPNVVLIFADDLGYGDLGCYGATKVQTPNIDKLAAQGRRFTDAHSASAVCTPSRYALLTGEYPLRKGLSRPVFLRTGLVIDAKQQTIAGIMKDAGYATACIGKWHLGFGKKAPDWNGELKPGPLELGFDYYFGVPVVNSHPPFVYVENYKVVGLVPDDPFVFRKKAKTREFPEKMGLDQIGGADAAHALYDDEAVGTTLTGKAVDWIKARKAGPFFLYLATTNVHHPFTPAPRFKGTSQCGRYGDFIHELDWIVGEVMKTLDELGVADNTLVIFTSDNGGMFNVGGQDAWEAGHRMNGELLGFKFSAWEGGHRVPFIARWPGKIEAGSTSGQLISNIDMPATLAALTGGKLRIGQARDSVNVLPALTGNPAEPLRDHLVLAASKPSHLAIRKGKWMYIGAQGGGGFTAAKRGAHAFGGPAAVQFTKRMNSDIENGKIKRGAPPAQLYDLEADLSQTTNLYRQQPEVVKELSELLGEYRVPARKLSAQVTRRPPNFVVILTDDQGYADVGCFGSPDIRTPRLDAMAREGMKFTSFYAQPICGPSRAALMTGCYPMRVAERGNIKQVHPILHSDEITVAEVLKARGYATACFGKWDLAKHSQRDFFIDLFPTRQGFDYFYGTPTSNDRIANLYRNEKLIEAESDMATLTRRYTDEAIAFMKKNAEPSTGSGQAKPFFVYIPHTMPHTRLDASAQFKGRSKRGLYGDVIEEIDFNVGRILDAIGEMGLGENTYVLFTSDNGPWLIKNKDHADGTLPGDHGGSAGPLRSGKVSTFEGGVRVPTILWGPKRVPAGTTCDKIASTLDILPTFAALADAQPPVDRVIDGENISHLFHGDFGKADPDKTYFYYLRVHLQAVRQGRWKLHLPREREPIGAAPFSRNSHIAPADRVGFDRPFLVDLKNDIGETTDVAEQNPQVVKRLLALAEGMREDLGDFDRVGKNMRFFDLTTGRPAKPPVPAARKRATKK